MTVALLAAIAAIAVQTVAATQLLRSQQRAHARREDLLLNQLLHAVGKPWQPAPADEPAAPPEPAELQPLRYVANPEQFPQ